MAILEGKQTAKDYFTKFEPFTLPFAYDFHGEIFESMPDGISIPTTCTYFS